jgi:quercetin dioxygenase-like cupin family protein
MRSTVVTVGAVGALAIASLAAPQDPIKSNPKNYQLVMENATVRVLRVTVAPGEKTTMHEHPDNGVVVFTDTKMRFTGADGKPVDAALKANEAMWSPAGKHAGENTGTAPIEGVIIELKGNAAPSATLPASRPDTTMTQLFDNPRARGMKVTIAPAFHEDAGTTHDYDQVVVALGDGDLMLNVGGKSKTSWKRGDAEFIGRGVKHESKNTGQKPLDVFILAIK